ncbi:O-antigen/teichoic acid export membrane protein [Planomicrobium soli]|uniref:O-antigen/teichoic acid export membrane protein n=1 Tax=Planomicrobium soli TaxID=1176648 RepID=A0A2P8H3B1_9BACL|nr:hypothetical protein [Planomicrobium soli]PSL40702.1 O-antigen/teichoic acid export membrane protein [Planomicrobium soli]
MRTLNAIRNILTDLARHVLTILLGFISRTIFISILGVEYLGVNGLFTNIIMMLSLANLGIGTAIVYKLYKPLAEKDDDKVIALMNFYKTAFRIIGIIVFLLGMIIIPFLDILVKEDIPDLKLIYVLFVLNSALSYFLVYNRSLISADQKNYKLVWIDSSFQIILTILQIAVLVITKDFVLYLITQILITFIQRVVITIRVRSLYPLLKSKKKIKLTIKEKKELFKNTYAIMIYNISTAVINGTDNIVITIFFGLHYVGLYANYFLLIVSIGTVLGKVFKSLTASVGNLIATDTNNKSYEMFNLINFLYFWLIGLITCCFYILMNPFILLWLGEDFLLPQQVVLPIVISFFTSCMLGPTNMFRNAQGLFVFGKYVPLVESILNILFSVVLAQVIGLSGVFWGTILSRAITSMWYDPYIVHKKGLKKSLIPYYITMLKYAFTIITTIIIIQPLISNFDESNLTNFIFKMGICLIFINTIFYLLYRKTKEFIYIKQVFVKIYSGKLKQSM